MKLSVLLITYNHERFIGQALAGALAQETDFDYEVVVGEDASTDGTAAIVRALQREHPTKVNAILRERNVGLQRNVIETYRACRGEYIAFLDGDDYWTAPHKLQRQVDFLDRHPDYSICFHNARVLNEDEAEPGSCLFKPPEGRTTFELEDLLFENFIPSCSMVARNRLIDSFPDWVLGVRCMDWVLNIFNACHGKVKYLDEAAAVYRQHAGGVWSRLPWEKRRDEILGLYGHLGAHLPPRTWPLVRAVTEKVRLFDGQAWLKQQLANHVAELERVVKGNEHTVAWAESLQKSNDWLRARVEGLEQAVRAGSAENRRLAEAAQELAARNEGLRQEVERFRPASASLHALYRRFERVVGLPALSVARRARALVSRAGRGPSRN